MNSFKPTAQNTLPSHPAGVVAWVNHLHFSIRIFLCLLLCWMTFQGFQGGQGVSTSLGSPPVITVECFGACGLDSIMDAEVVAATNTSQATCSQDNLWPCEPDNNDLDILPYWSQSLTVTVLKPCFMAFVPAHEFQLSPPLKPPRHLA